MRNSWRIDASSIGVLLGTTRDGGGGVTGAGWRFNGGGCMMAGNDWFCDVNCCCGGMPSDAWGKLLNVLLGEKFWYCENSGGNGGNLVMNDWLYC